MTLRIMNLGGMVGVIAMVLRFVSGIVSGIVSGYSPNGFQIPFLTKILADLEDTNFPSY